MPIVETYYRLDVQDWADSDDTVEVTMTREQAFFHVKEVLGLLENTETDQDTVTVAIVGALKVTDTMAEDRP